jgi:hypothetical protein
MKEGEELNLKLIGGEDIYSDVKYTFWKN